MKKIKFLMIAMMAFTVCTMFTACGDDDNKVTPPNPDPDPVVTPTTIAISRMSMRLLTLRRSTTR